MGKRRSRGEAWPDGFTSQLSANHTVKIRSAFPSVLQAVRGKFTGGVMAGDCTLVEKACLKMVGDAPYS